MDRDNGLGPWSDGPPGLDGIDIERVRVDIHEHGTSTQPRNRAGGREKRVCGRDDLVSRTDSERH